MIQKSLLLFTLVLFACTSDSNPTAPVAGADPVTVVTMGLSNVELNLSSEEDVATFKTNFAIDLAASLTASGFSIDASRIQVLDIVESTTRGNYDIEFLFLESEDSSATDVGDLLDTLAEDDFDVTSELFDVEDIGFTETDNAASCSVMLDVAEDELLNLLNTIYSCPSGNDDCHSESLDYEGLYGYYQDALEYCPTEPAANFGAAISGLLTVTTDETLWEFHENWRQWDQGNDDDFIFPDGNRSLGGSPASFGLPDGMNSFLIADKINFINYLPLSYLFSYMFMSDGGNDNDQSEVIIPETPDIEELMTIIETELIGRLTNSINYLENTVGQDYTFVITGEMQDHPEGDLEMDDTEFYAMKAHMHLLRGVLYGLTAYSIDVDAETFDSDFSYLEQNSSFLALRNSNALPNAHDDMMAMITSLYNGINFLDNETDGQSDDMIRQQEISDFNSEHESTIFQYLHPETGIAQEYFNDDFTEEICSQSCTYDDGMGGWSWYYQCEDVDCFDLTINLKNFMQSPPNNLKEIMPDYSIITTTVEETDYWSEYLHAPNTLDLSSCANISNGWNLDYGSPGVWYGMSESELEYNGNFDATTDFTYSSGNPESCSVLTDYVQAIYNNILDYVSSNSNISDLTSFAIQTYGYWPNYHNINIWISFDEIRPCIDWDAETFNEWKSDIGDITLSGLFPDMTMQQFMDNVLNIVEEDVDPVNGEDDWWDKHGDDCSEDDASDGF